MMGGIIVTGQIVDGLIDIIKCHVWGVPKETNPHDDQQTDQFGHQS